jgi:hypothetical protein
MEQTKKTISDIIKDYKVSRRVFDFAYENKD